MLFIFISYLAWLLIVRGFKRKITILGLEQEPEEMQAVSENPSPYRSSHFLLTKAERHFYTVLRKSIPANVSVSMKVRLADLVRCSAWGWRTGWGNKVSQKHVDFVLYNSINSYILLVIELDDSSHDLPERKLRDKLVDDVLKSAGIGILHVTCKSTYNVNELNVKLLSIMPSVYS